MREDQAVAALAALGNSLRFQIWRILRQQGDTGLAAGILARQVAVKPSALSFHLRMMMHAGIVRQRRCSRQIIYAAESGTTAALASIFVPGSAIALPPSCEIVSRSPQEGQVFE